MVSNGEHRQTINDGVKANDDKYQAHFTAHNGGICNMGDDVAGASYTAWHVALAAK